MKFALIGGIFMASFIVLLLLTKAQKKPTDNILASLIALLGIQLLGFYLYHSGFWQAYPHLIGVTAPVPLFYGPLLFLYARYALHGLQKVQRLDLIHLLPGAVCYLLMLRFFFFYSPAEKISVDLNEVEDYAIFANILLAAILLSGITYAALSFHLLRRHQAKIEDNFSYTEGISLQWLRVCIIAMALIFLTAAIVIVMRDVFLFSFPFNPEFAFYLLMISFILYVGYFGIRFENIFYSPSPASMGTQEAPAEKYVKSGIRAEEAREGYQKLLRYMEKEKPFLQPKLSLTALADCLGMSTNQLSQIINQQAGVHFHDFINSYRMQEFIKLAEMNKHYSLLALAFEAGFNSKSSFNLVFKRQTGLSPSQYLASKASPPQESL